MSFGLPEWRVCHLPSLSLAMSSKGHPHHLPKNEATAKKYLFFRSELSSWRFRLIVIYVFMIWNFFILVLVVKIAGGLE